MIDTLQKSVREVHLTISWKEGKLTENIDLVTHVVSLGPGSDRNGGAAGVAGAPGAAGAGYVRADNGMPVASPVPGSDGSMRDPADNTLVIQADQFGASAKGQPGSLVRPGGQFGLQGIGNIPNPRLKSGFPQ